ncbi:MAG: hypothetical protein JWO42_1243 [Chloroflexi bacterium]|nr:hypothetical protein [Chloroflexota bacterium]
MSTEEEACVSDLPCAPAMDKGPDQQLLNFQIGAVYYALLCSFERFVGCTLARYRVLYAFGHARELSQAWLQQHLELNAAAITRQVQAMEAEGLVVRRVDPADNRFTLVALTEKGQATVDTIRPMAREFGAKLQEGCDPEELAITSRLLETLRQRALNLAPEPLSNAVPAVE